MGTVTVFRDSDDPPYAEVVLDNGDRLGLTVDKGALVIRRLYDSGSDTVLFEAQTDLVVRICAALSGPRRARRTTPLQILSGVVAQIGSAAHVRAAFREAARAI